MPLGQLELGPPASWDCFQINPALASTGATEERHKAHSNLLSSLKAEGRFVQLVHVQQQPLSAHVSNHHVPGAGVV